MTPAQFITCISIYILSLVIGLLLMIAGKKAAENVFKKSLFIHLLIAFVFIVALILANFAAIGEGSIIYFSLGFFCSGVALSGLMLRSKMNILIKIYFGIYAASFFLFVSSPSTLFSLITKGKLKVEQYDRFAIKDNYFLDKQSSFIGNSSGPANYKIVQKLGYFNKTITRDLVFANQLDSIKTLSFIPNKLVILRGYFSQQGVTDSADVSVDLAVLLKKNQIKLKNNN